MPTLSVKIEGWPGIALDTKRKACSAEVAFTLLKPMAISVPRDSTEMRVRYDPSRGPAMIPGSNTILLSASGSYWGQYVYQFAHEFCHWFINPDLSGAEREGSHQWFEETLCEVASVYILLTMETFGGVDLLEYARNRKNKVRSKKLISPEEPLGPWLRMREAELRADRLPFRRCLHQVVADRLVPLFLDSPTGWNAVCSLPVGEAGLDVCDITGYLEEWSKRCDQRDRLFVDEVKEAMCN